MATSRYKLGTGALIAALLLALLLWLQSSGNHGGDAASREPATAAAPPPSISSRPAAPTVPAISRVVAPPADEPARSMAGGQPFWRPGAPHWYGPKDDAFIRQPHDYDPSTPAKLGDRIGQRLFDLERVSDMVRRGTEGDSDIARLRGAPLEEAELAEARVALQTFFDQTVPEIDAVLSDQMSLDAAFGNIAARRLRLDQQLRTILGLTESQFAELWPHLAGP